MTHISKLVVLAYTFAGLAGPAFATVAPSLDLSRESANTDICYYCCLHYPGGITVCGDDGYGPVGGHPK